MYNFGEFTFDDFLLLEGTLPIIVKNIGIRIYDFNFRDFLECRSIFSELELPGVLRIGAVAEYQKLYDTMKEQGINLIHTPEEFNLCTLLPRWYPLIKDLTPKAGGMILCQLLNK